MMVDDLNMRWTHLMVSIPPFRIQIKQWSRRAAEITGLTALMSLAVHTATLGYVGADTAPTSMHHEAWLLHRDHPTQPALIGSVDLPQPLSLQVAPAARAGRRLQHRRRRLVVHGRAQRRPGDLRRGLCVRRRGRARPPRARDALQPLREREAAALQFVQRMNEFLGVLATEVCQLGLVVLGAVNHDVG